MARRGTPDESAPVKVPTFVRNPPAGFMVYGVGRNLHRPNIQRVRKRRYAAFRASRTRDRARATRTTPNARAHR